MPASASQETSEFASQRAQRYWSQNVIYPIYFRFQIEPLLQKFHKSLKLPHDIVHQISTEGCACAVHSGVAELVRQLACPLVMLASSQIRGVPFCVPFR
jgi:hypothetical protein